MEIDLDDYGEEDRLCMFETILVHIYFNFLGNHPLSDKEYTVEVSITHYVNHDSFVVAVLT